MVGLVVALTLHVSLLLLPPNHCRVPVYLTGERLFLDFSRSNSISSVRFFFEVFSFSVLLLRIGYPSYSLQQGPQLTRFGMAAPISERTSCCGVVTDSLVIGRPSYSHVSWCRESSMPTFKPDVAHTLFGSFYREFRGDSATAEVLAIGFFLYRDPPEVLNRYTRITDCGRPSVGCRGRLSPLYPDLRVCIGLVARHGVLSCLVSPPLDL